MQEVPTFIEGGIFRSNFSTREFQNNTTRGRSVLIREIGCETLELGENTMKLYIRVTSDMKGGSPQADV